MLWLNNKEQASPRWCPQLVTGVRFAYTLYCALPAAVAGLPDSAALMLVESMQCLPIDSPRISDVQPDPATQLSMQHSAGSFSAEIQWFVKSAGRGSDHPSSPKSLM
jgi:hypothetical protein